MTNDQAQSLQDLTGLIHELTTSELNRFEQMGALAIWLGGTCDALGLATRAGAATDDDKETGLEMINMLAEKLDQLRKEEG